MTSKRSTFAQAELVGHLGNTPTLYYALDDETPYTRLFIATSESFTSKAGVTQDRTEWHSALAWGSRAIDIADQYFQKGDAVVLTGDLHINNYPNDNHRYHDHLPEPKINDHDGEFIDIIRTYSRSPYRGHRDPVLQSFTELDVTDAKANVTNEPPRNISRLIGEVRETPITKTLDIGVQLTTVSIAVRRTVHGREDEDQHTATFWGKTAAGAAADIKPGDTVAIHGSLRHRTITGDNRSYNLSAIHGHKFQILERALNYERPTAKGLGRW